MQACDAGGQLDVRGDGFDGNVPFVAGHVPVKLVVIVEEADRVEHAVTDDDGARGVFRIRHVNFEFGVAALAALLVFERMAVVVGDAERLEKKRVIQALRRGVFDRNGAIDAVPVRAGELRVNDFGDFDRAVGVDSDLLVEMLDDELRAAAGAAMPAASNDQEKTNGEKSTRFAE